MQAVNLEGLTLDARIRAAFEFIDGSSARFTAEQIRICEIPAPPFKEQERGRYFAARFNELGLSGRLQTARAMSSASIAVKASSH
ncbi:MAG: hypothetical protein IPL01_21225 [Acidobacteria bacterium]|nr:hypothetical protein [Acidobacteriota bacterium]